MPREPAFAKPPEAVSSRFVPATSDVPNCALKSAAVRPAFAALRIQTTIVDAGAITTLWGVAGHRVELVVTGPVSALSV